MMHHDASVRRFGRVATIGTLFTFATFAFGQAYVPYNWYPPFGGSSQDVSGVFVSGTEFTRTVTGTDGDQWWDNNGEEGEQVVVQASTAHTVKIKELRSGTTVTWVQQSYAVHNESGVGHLGTYTFKHTIRALDVRKDEIWLLRDEYRVTDENQGVIALKDADLILEDEVSIAGPAGTGGAGGGG